MLRDDPCPVMGLTEIAARLAFSKTYVRELSRQTGFPKRWRLAGIDVWPTDEIEAWIKVRFPDRAKPPA